MKLTKPPSYRQGLRPWLTVIHNLPVSVTNVNQHEYARLGVCQIIHEKNIWNVHCAFG